MPTAIEIDEDEMLELQEKKRPLGSSRKPLSHLHEFYLSGEIGEPSRYAQWFDQIRHAGPMDVVKIYLNCHGGNSFTTIQFIRAMRESKARVVVSVEGMCASAATMVFLMADDFEVTPHSVFMFHNFSGASVGKGGEMFDQTIHMRGWSEKLLRHVYADFLTPSEIDGVLKDRDIWMTSDEVVKRLNVKKKVTAKRQKVSEKKS